MYDMLWIFDWWDAAHDIEPQFADVNDDEIPF